MKTETYFHPRFKRFKPNYRHGKVFASSYRTKGDSKSARRKKATSV